MNTTAIPTPELRNVPVDLGFLFGYLSASVIGGCVGAHVKLNPDNDESVIADTMMTPLPESADPLEVARAMRRVAASVVMSAGREVGHDIDWAMALGIIAPLIPLTPILEAMIEAGQ